MPAKRTMRFLAARSGTSLLCAARSWALVGFQGVGNVRFIGRPTSVYNTTRMGAEGIPERRSGLDIFEFLQSLKVAAGRSTPPVRWNAIAPSVPHRMR